MYSMALYWVLGTLMLAGWLAYIVLKRRKKVVAASTDEQNDEATEGSLTSDAATELQALLTPEEFKFLYDLPEEKRAHYLVLKGWVRIHDSDTHLGAGDNIYDQGEYANITRVWRQFAHESTKTFNFEPLKTACFKVLVGAKNHDVDAVREGLARIEEVIGVARARSKEENLDKVNAELTRQWRDLRRRFWDMYEADVELFENCDDLIWIRKTLDENKDTSLSLETYSEVKRMLGHVQAQRVAVGISPDRKRKMFRLLSRYPNFVGGEQFSMPKGYSWGFYRNGKVEPTRHRSIYVSYFDGNLLRTRLH